MGKYKFEQTIMGASFYQNDKLICTVSGLEDAERLKILLDEKEDRLDLIEATLKDLLNSVIEMDFNKQKELIHLSKNLLHFPVKQGK